MTHAPSERSYAVVLNLSAGGGLARREWPRLEAELRTRHLSFELIREESGEAALRRVQALPADVALLAVGGDGTVGALLSALVAPSDSAGLDGEAGRPLGIVPLGTGNDFAGMLGLKAGDFAAALDRLSFAPRRVDALRATILGGDGAGRTHLLLNGLGLGFDAQLTARLPQAPAALSGLGRYAWAALSTLRALSLTDVTVEVDGQTLYAGRSCLAAVMNGTRYGGGFHISPASDPRDGRLNVLASGPVNRAQLLALMGRVLPGRHLGHPRVHHTAGRSVTVTWAKPTYLHLDGDLAGQVTGVRVEVLPGAVTLLNA